MSGAHAVALDVVFAGGGVDQALTGRKTFTPLTNPTGPQQILHRMAPPLTDLVAGGFNFFQAEFANQGGGDQSNRKNQTWGYGYNSSSVTPSADKAGEPAFHESWETYYNPVAGFSYLERHFLYTHPSGAPSARIWSTQVRRENNYIDTGFIADNFYVNDQNNVPRISVNGSNLKFFNSTGIEVEVNNYAFLRQLNQLGNGYRELVRLSNADRVMLGGGYAFVVTADTDMADGDTALFIHRNKAGAFSSQRVTQGATDSGGAGFKALRVAN